MSKPCPIHLGAISLIGLSLFTASVTIRAQIRRPSDERLPPPIFPSEPTERPFLLPPVEEPEPTQAPLSSQIRVFVRAFRILGNTVLDPAALKQAVAPYVGKVVTGAELQTLRQHLTQLYVTAGYINSGVILPDQTVRDGVITFQVIEGTLSRVEVTGSSGCNLLTCGTGLPWTAINRCNSANWKSGCGYCMKIASSTACKVN